MTSIAKILNCTCPVKMLKDRLRQFPKTGIHTDLAIQMHGSFASVASRAHRNASNEPYLQLHHNIKMATVVGTVTPPMVPQNRSPGPSIAIFVAMDGLPDQVWLLQMVARTIYGAIVGPSCHKWSLI